MYEMNLPDRVFMTGFMGAGKTTIGRLLAERIRYGFVDVDDRIVERAGCPVPVLFEREGEKAFRIREREALEATARERQTVIAVGGGALTTDAAIQWARAHGLVVFLEVEAADLVRRLHKGAADRPMLCDAGGRPLAPDAMQARIEALLKRRETYYRQAHLRVETTGCTKDEAIERVMKRLTETFGRLPQ